MKTGPPPGLSEYVSGSRPFFENAVHQPVSPGPAPGEQASRPHVLSYMWCWSFSQRPLTRRRSPEPLMQPPPPRAKSPRAMCLCL